MAFVKKTWKDRIVQYANRRLLTKSGGEVEQVTVTRDEGAISEAGDQFNASNMNNLEQRIEDGLTGLTASDIEYSGAVTVKQAIDSKQDSLTVQTITPTRNTTNISTSGYAVSCLKFGRVVVLSVSMTTARALTTDNVILSDLPIPQYDTLRLGLSVIDANNVRVKINASGEMSLHYDDLASGDVIFGEVTYISAT